MRLAPAHTAAWRCGRGQCVQGEAGSATEEAEDLIQQVGQKFLAHDQRGGVGNPLGIDIAGLDGHDIMDVGHSGGNQQNHDPLDNGADDSAENVVLGGHGAPAEPRGEHRQVGNRQHPIPRDSSGQDKHNGDHNDADNDDTGTAHKDAAVNSDIELLALEELHVLGPGLRCV